MIMLCGLWYAFRNNCSAIQLFNLLEMFPCIPDIHQSGCRSCNTNKPSNKHTTTIHFTNRSMNQSLSPLHMCLE